MKIIYVLILLPAFGFIGCNSLSNDKHLTGNIYLLKNEDDKSYHIVVYGDSINSNIIEEPVLFLEGNDTLIITRCEGGNHEILFYKINFDKSKDPVPSLISPQEYNQRKLGNSYNYSFGNPNN